MRFIIMVRATDKTEAGVLPDDALISAMATYHEELAKAGVLLDASGFHPSAKGWRVRYRRWPAHDCGRPVRGNQGTHCGLHVDPGALA